MRSDGDVKNLCKGDRNENGRKTCERVSDARTQEVIGDTAHHLYTCGGTPALCDTFAVYKILALSSSMYDVLGWGVVALYAS